MHLSGPLYLAPLRKERNWSRTKVWLSHQPIGVNVINIFMQSIARQGGLDVINKRFTNHSVRKTTVKKLKKAGVSSREIMAITGHKNKQSLADYDNLDLDDQLHLGEILSRSSNSSDAATPTVTHCPSSSTSHIPIASNCSFPSVPMVFHNCHVTFGLQHFPRTLSLSPVTLSRTHHITRERGLLSFTLTLTNLLVTLMLRFHLLHDSFVCSGHLY